MRLCPEQPGKQRWHTQINVELFPVQAITRTQNLHIRKIGIGRGPQPLGHPGGKGETASILQINLHAAGCRIVACGPRAKPCVWKIGHHWLTEITHHGRKFQLPRRSLQSPPKQMPSSRKPHPQAFRPHAETFEDIVWDPHNRRQHLEKRPEVDFLLTRHRSFDWSRIKKRKDPRHRFPDRFQALVALRVSDPPPVFFVVYSRVAKRLNIISIRFANAEERDIFFNH